MGKAPLEEMEKTGGRPWKLGEQCPLKAPSLPVLTALTGRSPHGDPRRDERSRTV